jgi:putative ABC transport system substrate-binding protein
MKRAAALSILVAVVMLAFAVIAEAQQPEKVSRIGYLSSQSLSANSTRIEAFRQGLRELGYVEGKNIVVEYRHAEGKQDGLPRARGRTGASKWRSSSSPVRYPLV